MTEDVKFLKYRPATLHIHPDSLKFQSIHVSPEERFRQRALNFLRSITTGSSHTARSQNIPEPLQLIPCESTPHLGITRTQEEHIEIRKIQAWVTSGVIKKSYKHCLNISQSLIPRDRVLIQVSEYPGYIVPSPIKEKLNEDFSELHPHLEQRLTLSKLSNLREDLIVKVWKTSDFDPTVLAVGLTCFDRLLDLNLVNKINRKLFAAVCVLLAFKFFEEKMQIGSRVNELLSRIYDMDKKDLLTPRIIFEAEFTVYAYLNFSIHLNLEEIKDNLEYIRLRMKAE